jgi:hypothetical protein
MKYIFGAAALAFAASAFVAPAPAMAQNIGFASPQAIAKVLRDKGYQAEIQTSGETPVIRSAAGGAKFAVLFMNCTKGAACTTIQFYAGFTSEGSVPMAKMNEWNKTKRFARGYLDSDNDPVVEMDLDLDAGGMSQALFTDNFEVWTSLLASFQEHIKTTK